jgi:hypothetical protein
LWVGKSEKQKTLPEEDSISVTHRFPALPATGPSPPRSVLTASRSVIL